MSRKAAQARSETTEVYPIRTVAALTGVNPVTLRAWERRYGLIEPTRTASGHRMYTREQVDRVTRVLSLLEKGVSIGQASRSLGGGRAGGSHAPDVWSSTRERMAAAVTRFDEAALDDAYNEALSLHPLDLVTRHVLVPVLAELGRRWESQEGSVVEEHFFSTYVRNKLGARFHHRARLSAGAKLLCACAPGEHHEIGLLLFALAAHDAGMRPVLLGGNTPVEQLPLAANRSECDAIVISCSIQPDRAVLEEQLPALVAEARKPVFVGGAVSASHRDAIARAGAIPLGVDLAVGVRRIASTLGAERSRT